MRERGQRCRAAQVPVDGHVEVGCRAGSIHDELRSGFEADSPVNRAMRTQFVCRAHCQRPKGDNRQAECAAHCGQLVGDSA